MMTCCATARWKLPTKPSGSADKKWLFLISTSPLLFSSTLLVALANITRFTDLSTGTIPSFRTLLEYHMMIPHWAPTILDGYAYYGRPQKPRRLIFSATFYVHISVAELRLTTQSVCYSPTACKMSLGKHIPTTQTLRNDEHLMTSPTGSPGEDLKSKISIHVN
jgi:hypothetical protein